MTWLDVRRLMLVYKLMLSKLIPVSIRARLNLTSHTHCFAIFCTEGKKNKSESACREPGWSEERYSPVCE